MGKKKQQKVVVGDESGVLTCFGVTKGSVVVCDSTQASSAKCDTNFASRTDSKHSPQRKLVEWSLEVQQRVEKIKYL